MKTRKMDLHTVLLSARLMWRQLENKKGYKTNQTEIRKFRETFGCSPSIVVQLWAALLKKKLLPEKGSIDHLLTSLLFLKLYPTNSAICVYSGNSSNKTNTKWNWIFIEAIAGLEKEYVSFCV